MEARAWTHQANVYKSILKDLELQSDGANVYKLIGKFHFSEYMQCGAEAMHVANPSVLVFLLGVLKASLRKDSFAGGHAVRSDICNHVVKLENRPDTLGCYSRALLADIMARCWDRIPDNRPEMRKEGVTNLYLMGSTPLFTRALSS